MKRYLTGILILFLVACGGRDEKDAATAGTPQTPQLADVQPVAYTTFYPTSFMAESIAGGFLNVVCPLPEEVDPITWMPSESIVEKYQNADLIIINGASFEKWVGKVSLPDSKLIDTAKGLEEGFIHYQNARSHSHGPEGEHTHEGIDGHTWLDPVAFKHQSGAIRDSFVKKYPENTTAFDNNYEQLVEQIDQMDTRMTQITVGLGNTPLLASHPAYNYLVRRYGWNIVNLDLDPETMPTPEMMSEIRQMKEKHPAEFLLWESEPDPEISAKIKTELGLESVVFSPVEMLTEAEKIEGADFLSVMYENLVSLEAIVSVN